MFQVAVHHGSWLHELGHGPCQRVWRCWAWGRWRWCQAQYLSAPGQISDGQASPARFAGCGWSSTGRVAASDCTRLEVYQWATHPIHLGHQPVDKKNENKIKGHRRVVPKNFFSVPGYICGCRSPLVFTVVAQKKYPGAVNRTLGRMITTHTRGFAARARRP